jgi:hypothetical protein
MELPAMCVVLRFPIDGQGRLHFAAGVDYSQPIQDQSPRQAIGPNPRIAFDLHVQRAAIMRTRSAWGRGREQNQEKTNCKSP